MAFLRKMLDMSLSGVRVELCEGHIAVLYHGDERVAHVRVDSLEDANRLEAIAKTPQVYGIWRPNYLYEGEALSVSDFEADVAKNPSKYAYVKEESVPVAKKRARGR